MWSAESATIVGYRMAPIATICNDMNQKKANENPAVSMDEPEAASKYLKSQNNRI